MISREQFRKLASDAAYRIKATRDPNLITQDFKLSLAELEALRDAAEMSGADLSRGQKSTRPVLSTAFGAAATGRRKAENQYQLLLVLLLLLRRDGGLASASRLTGLQAMVVAPHIAAEMSVRGTISIQVLA